MPVQKPGGDSLTTSDPRFESLLVHLKQSRGFDFSAYKRASLLRRVHIRMREAGVGDFAQYQSALDRDPEEFTRLFNTILINVTGFFRDGPAVWNFLTESVLPAVIARSGRSGRIRVWSAGCASGEEAYSVAMLLAGALGRDGFRERVKIYATDADEEALREGRQAVFAERSLEDVPPSMRGYFCRVGERFALDRDLRRAVLFGRHDLIQDPPISKIDLLLCRNCMMYFNADAQSRILAKFQYSLADGGFLVLGKAETLPAGATSFTPLDPQRRIFTRQARPRVDRSIDAEGDRNHGTLRRAVVAPEE